jgi:hypothetical protein
MKKSFNCSRIAGAIALLALTVGCATTDTSSRQNMLAAAGFQQNTADTPRKQELLNTLPRNQLTLVRWRGQNYYVQPDATAANIAWVGRAAEYQAYQQLRLARQLSNENLQAAQLNRHAMASWGNAWGPGFHGNRWRRTTVVRVR